MKKRVMAVLSVLLILAIVFTGCAAPAQSSEPAQNQAATEAPNTGGTRHRRPGNNAGGDGQHGRFRQGTPQGRLVYRSC